MRRNLSPFFSVLLLVGLLCLHVAHAQTLLLLGAGKGASGGCATATTFLARTSGLDATHTTAYTNLICGLVTDGVWTSLDVLYILATQDSTTAGLNLISTSYTLSVTGTPTFTADHGYNGFTTSNYLDTGFNPSTAGGGFSRNSAHLAVWDLTSRASQATYALGADTTNLTIIIDLGGLYYGDINGSSGGNTNTNSLGYWLSNRSASNATQDYKNGSSFGTTSIASVALTNRNVFVGGSNSGAGISLPTTDQLAAVNLGASLSATDTLNLYTRINTFLVAVGAV